jgi:hypothetical protein
MRNVCPFVPFRLAFVLSVLLRLTTSYYDPLVYSNIFNHH